jgi:redox-regulated HSP33 family molecular chaperone
MRSLLNYITLCLFLCLSSELLGQGAYTLLKQGERSPYDSAVAIRIQEYRQLRLKIITGDSLITSQALENKFLYQVIEKKDSNAVAQAFAIQRQRETIKSKDQTITELNQTYKDLEQVALKPRRRGLFFGLGAAASFLTIYTASKL